MATIDGCGSWWRFPLAAGIVLLSDMGPVGCGGACTTAGCSDQFQVSITSADGSIPPGTHVLSVVADDTPLTCTFQFPFAEGPQFVPSCPGLWVQIIPATICTETVTAAARSLTCTAIPGQFIEQFTLMGKPTKVHVTLTVDGAMMLDRMDTPAYQRTQPNGPKCEPTCQQASATWMFSAP